MNYPRLSLCLFAGFFLAATAQSQTPTPPPPASSSANVYTEATVDKAPALKRRLKPDFPSSAGKRDNPGEVTLRYVVTVEGKVVDIVIAKFNNAEMVEPAYIALEQAEFTPGQKAGKPVSVRMETTFIYPEPKAPKTPKNKPVESRQDGIPAALKRWPISPSPQPRSVRRKQHSGWRSADSDAADGSPGSLADFRARLSRPSTFRPRFLAAYAQAAR
jgi:hypothetical protein